MDRARAIGILMLASAAALCPAEVLAQGRGPSAKELRERAAVEPGLARATKLAELDAWLRRMTGRFRSGEGQQRTITDCAGIGTGPGVHCIRSARDEAPTMTMYGVDPDVPGIRVLQVDGRSIAEGDVGRLSGDTLTFSKVRCPTTLDPRAQIYTTVCERQLRIYAPPGGRYVLIQTYTFKRVYMPTPTGQRRRGSNPVTQIVEYTQDVQLDRMPPPVKPD